MWWIHWWVTLLSTNRQFFPLTLTTKKGLWRETNIVGSLAFILPLKILDKTPPNQLYAWNTQALGGKVTLNYGHRVITWTQVSGRSQGGDTSPQPLFLGDDSNPWTLLMLGDLGWAGVVTPEATGQVKVRLHAVRLPLEAWQIVRGGFSGQR